MPKRRSKKPKKNELKRFAEYMVTGGAWFWSGYILIVLLDNHIGLFWANLVGNGVGITINFLLSRYWVFSGNKKQEIGDTALRYVIYTGLNAFLLNYLILLGLNNVGIKPEIGQFVASAFFTVWNYFWYKFYIFPDKVSKSTHKPHHYGNPFKIFAHHERSPHAYRTRK